MIGKRKKGKGPATRKQRNALRRRLDERERAEREKRREVWASRYAR